MTSDALAGGAGKRRGFNYPVYVWFFKGNVTPRAIPAINLFSARFWWAYFRILSQSMDYTIVIEEWVTKNHSQCRKNSKPFKYKKKLYGSQAEGFLAKWKRYKLSLESIDDQVLLIFSNP